MDNTYESKLSEGIQAFYAADWKTSNSIFSELKKMDEDKPMAYFMDAMIPFWIYFFGGEEERYAEEFQNKSTKAITIAKNYLKEQPADTSTILILSGLFGYRSLVAANETNYGQAMRAGIDGYSYTRKLMDMDTDNPNALIGQGMFQYMVGSVPSAFRWMANMAGLRGDKEQGFAMLKEASLSDSYVSVDAAMILCYLYIREEKFNEAADIIAPVAEQYPDNMIFQFYLGKSLDKSGNQTAALQAYRNVITNRKSELESLVQQSRERLEVLKAEI